MEEIIKFLEQIKEHQMGTVQLARSTEVYKIADKALTKALFIEANKHYLFEGTRTTDNVNFKILKDSEDMETAILDMEQTHPTYKWVMVTELI